MTLILASRSAARRQMLEAAGVPFTVAAAAFDEDMAKAGLEAAGFAPRDLAEMLAEMKAKNVAGGDSLVLGADQMLELDDGATLGKPGSRAEALDQLRALSGRTHFLHSAAVVAQGGERIWGATESVTLKVRPLGEAFLRTYLDREGDAVQGSAGSYRLEGLGAQLFESIEGSHFAVLGLPLLPLLAFLRGQRELES